MLVSDFGHLVNVNPDVILPAVSHTDTADTSIALNYQWRRIIIGLVARWSVEVEDEDNQLLFELLEDFYD